MKVVENNAIVGALLRDELERCLEVLNGIRKAISGLPKGAISQREKRYRHKVYSYHYLKYRDGEKIIGKHVPNSEI